MTEMPRDPSLPYVVGVGAETFAMTEFGWAGAAFPMHLRIAWLVPDGAPRTPYVLDDTAIEDLREAMDRVIALGAEAGNREAIAQTVQYEKTGTATPTFPREKVWVMIDALVAQGFLLEGPRRFGLRSVVLPMPETPSQ